MYCRKCGAKLREGHNFCTNCGESIVGAERPINKNEMPNDYYSAPIVKDVVLKVDKVDDKPLAKEGLIIGLVFCVLVASIASIFIVSYYSNDIEPKYYERGL